MLSRFINARPAEMKHKGASGLLLTVLRILTQLAIFLFTGLALNRAEEEHAESNST